MWRAIDKEMKLTECSIYSYSPDDDVDDDEDGVIWSFNFLFFNKVKKRVCYIYFKGLSLMSQTLRPRTPAKSKQEEEEEEQDEAECTANDDGARKRARYWLGRRAAQAELHDDDDDSEVTLRISGRAPEPPVTITWSPDSSDRQRKKRRIGESYSPG